MQVQLPPIAETRAIIIGVEDYPHLTTAGAVPGAVQSALNFARWFIGQGGDASQIELWLAPKKGEDLEELRDRANLGEASVRRFCDSGFVREWDLPHRPFDQGSFLIVYWCGHGAVSGDVSNHYVILPDAKPDQFRSISLQNWQAFFQTGSWKRFSHQLWIVDACRNDWGAKFKPNAQGWTVEKPGSVRRCTISACAVGETAITTSSNGPEFSRKLIDAFGRDPKGSWPDFVQSARMLAASAIIDSDQSRHPVVVLEDWDGTAVRGRGLAGATPEQMLERLAWSIQDFQRCARAALAVVPVFAAQPKMSSVEDIVASLHNLQKVDNIPPLYDFLERVARESNSDEIADWLSQRVTAAQRAGLNRRLTQGPVSALLSLWYQNDEGAHSIAADLQIIDRASGIQSWSSGGLRAVSEDTVGTLLGEWMREVNDRVGRRSLKLNIELCMPMDLLSRTQLDIATIPLADGDEVRFGEDHLVLLRSADRYKTRGKWRRFDRFAPAIFARLGSIRRNPVWWAHSNNETASWKSEMMSGAADAPIWLGFHPQLTGCAPLEQAVAEGLPAVVWCRASDTVADMAQLHASLEELLLAPLDELPDALAAWRRGPLAIAKPALLLDDPGREPPMWSQWNQPGE